MARKTLSGIPVSTGITIGRVHVVNRGRFCLSSRQTVAEELVDQEIHRLKYAFDQALVELEEIRAKVPEELREHATIIDSHLMILRDPKLRKSAQQYVQEMRLNAEWGLEKAVNDIEEVFANIEDEYFRDRILDVRAVAERIYKQMLGFDEGPKAITSRVILVAHDLTPADTIELEVNKIMGFVTALGGKTSHVGILARSLQIPAVVGVTDLEDSVRDNEEMIIDGLRGELIIGPDEQEIARYTELQEQFEVYQSTIMRSCHLPGETIDGYRVNVLANIELFEEVTSVLDHGGEGIGLYRTEYTYLNRSELPSENELFEEYQDLASIVAPQRVIIRTLDLGGDKLSELFGPVEEANPALGLRAIRFCRKHPHVFRTQLRAILRASVTQNISIMFPMVSGLNELVELKQIVEGVKQELRQEGTAYNPEIPIGIMVELPSAVMTADILAHEVDFFSIGTNDLIQYSLGIDRANKHVSYLYQPLHPALLRSIKSVVDAGHQAGIEVTLCGEMASDPFCVPILMGMQIDNLSINPQSIPGIKRIIRNATMQECLYLLKQVINSSSVAMNNALVQDIIFKRFPEEIMFYSSMLGHDELGPTDLENHEL
ncbi:MAG: phosphoenolpyruvate--protein phosphotransferase [Thermodesulfobacteriota bacterium]